LWTSDGVIHGWQVLPYEITARNQVVELPPVAF
jgi:hypothetical protein